MIIFSSAQQIILFHMAQKCISLPVLVQAILDPFLAGLHPSWLREFLPMLSSREAFGE